jgi:DNA-binding transcriptional regulator YiaG
MYNRSMPTKSKTKRPGRKLKYGWDAAKVKALRDHMQLTQTAMSEELGVRQQTVSEWETGLYAPRGASAKLLSILAERAKFKYGTSEKTKTDS